MHISKTTPVPDCTVIVDPKRHLVVGMCTAAIFVCYIDRVNISVAVMAMQESYGWSETVKGFVLSSFFIGYLLFLIPSGYLANRFGGKVVLGVAVVWWSLATLITPMAAMASLPALIAARIAMGVGEAATFPAIYNLYARWVPRVERSRAISLAISGIPLGTLFALGTTGWLIHHYGWQSVFYAFALPGFLWAFFWFAKIRDNPAQPPQPITEQDSTTKHAGTAKESGKSVSWRGLLQSKAVWALVINHFCSNWALYMLMAWLPSFFRAKGISIVSAGLFSATPWITMFVMVNVAGILADHWVKHGASLTLVRKTMQVIGLIGSAAFLILARDASSALTALFLMCGALGALGFTWSGYAPNHLEIAPRHSDILIAITNTAGTIPGIVGVSVTGWLLDLTGSYSSPFMLAAGVNIIGAAIWIAFCQTEPLTNLKH